MDFSDQSTTNLNSSPTPPSAGYTERRTRKPRSAGCAILFIVAFLVGVIVTLAGVFSYILFFANGNTQPVASSSSSAAGAILVETKAAYMSQVVQKNMTASSIPGGQLSDAQVSFTHNGPMVITANVQFGILGISTTRQLTLALQPYISSCQLHMHVVQADLQGFPITVFVQSFESQINSQMQMTATGLPPGFNYCVTNVHTEPDGLYLTYSATPTQRSLNKGILDRTTYLPVATRVWNASVNVAIQADGSLGYVQATGDNPASGQPVTAQSSLTDSF